MEGLVIKDRNGKFDPALAESWNVSDDAKTWTFHLQNTSWNDGVPFTCSDVKFTNDYMKSNNLTMGYVLDVQSIDCPDNHTAIFTLKTSYSGFLDQISRTRVLPSRHNTSGRMSAIPSTIRTPPMLAQGHSSSNGQNPGISS